MTGIEYAKNKLIENYGLLNEFDEPDISYADMVNRLFSASEIAEAYEQGVRDSTT